MDEDEKNFMDHIEKGILLYWATLAQARGLQFVCKKDFSYVISDNRKRPERILDIHLDDGHITDRIYEILAHIKAGKLPDSFLMTSRTKPEKLPELLQSMGFDIDISGLCMAMDLGKAQYGDTLISGLELLELENEDLLPQWMSIVNTALFGCELMSYDQFSDIFRLENTRFYVAILEGLPISVCMTISQGDTAVLEMVATLCEYRKRGIATAVIGKALFDLQKAGIHVVTLRAEVDGIGIYKKVGFKEYCKRTVASCNWDLIFKKSCPCHMDDETIKNAEEIYRCSSSIADFVEEMERRHVIGQKIWYDANENSIFITKRFSCECGRDCPQNDCNIRNRCHCAYFSSSNEQIPISYCKCSAEFYRPMFAPIFGDNVLIEPMETVLCGAEQCTFAIRINCEEGVQKK